MVYDMLQFAGANEEDFRKKHRQEAICQGVLPLKSTHFEREGLKPLLATIKH